MRTFLLAFLFLPLWGCAAVHSNLVDQIGTRYPVDTLYARVQSGFDALLRGSGGFEQLVKP